MRQVLEVGTLYAENLLCAHQLYMTAEDFLVADIIVPCRSITMEGGHAFCRPSTDIDGRVIEVDDLSAILAPIHYLRLPKCKALMVIRGVNIAIIDGGYFVDLIAIPCNLSNPDLHMARSSFVREKTLEVLNEIMWLFKRKLFELPPEDLACNSIQKTCLDNLGNMNLLVQDQEFILGLLNSYVLQLCSTPGCWRVMRALKWITWCSWTV